MQNNAKAYNKSHLSFKIQWQGEAFLNAYHALNKSCTAESLFTGIPSIVCLALAVELYIKDLHFLLRGDAPKKHDIFKLFDSLPQSIQQEICDHTSIRENPLMTKGDLLSPKYYSQTYNRHDRFIDQMKAISSGFQKWRYSYESTILTYDSSFALALINAIKSVANNTRIKIINEAWYL